MPRYIRIRIRIMLVAALLTPMLLVPTLNIVLAQKGGPIIIQRPGQPQVIIQPKGGPNGGATILEGGRPVGVITPGGPNGGRVIINQPIQTNPRTVWVTAWYCTKCGRLVGQGNNPPPTGCQFCLTVFKPGVNEPTQKKIEQPAEPEKAETKKQQEEQPDDTWASGSTMWIVAPIVAVIIVALAAVTGIVLFVGRGQSARKAKKSRRRERRSSYDDDIDDDWK